MIKRKAVGVLLALAVALGFTATIAAPAAAEAPPAAVAQTSVTAAEQAAATAKAPTDCLNSYQVCFFWGGNWTGNWWRDYASYGCHKLAEPGNNYHNNQAASVIFHSSTSGFPKLSLFQGGQCAADGDLPFQQMTRPSSDATFGVLNDTLSSYCLGPDFSMAHCD